MPGSPGPPAADEVCEVIITAPDPEWLVEFTRQLVIDRLCASGHNFTTMTVPGITRAMFRVAISGRREQKQSFFTVIVWRGQAENAAETLPKGSRAVVVGPVDRKAAARLGSGHGQGQERRHGAAHGLSPRHRGLQQR